MDAPRAATGGDRIQAQVRVEGEKDGAAMLRVRSSDGREYLKQSLLLKDGAAAVSIPLPLNASPGIWTVEVADAVTGAKGAAGIEVR